MVFPYTKLILIRYSVFKFVIAVAVAVEEEDVKMKTTTYCKATTIAVAGMDFNFLTRNFNIHKSSIT